MKGKEEEKKKRRKKRRRRKGVLAAILHNVVTAIAPAHLEGVRRNLCAPRRLFLLPATASPHGTRCPQGFHVLYCLFRRRDENVLFCLFHQGTAIHHVYVLFLLEPSAQYGRSNRMLATIPHTCLSCHATLNCNRSKICWKTKHRQCGQPTREVSSQPI